MTDRPDHLLDRPRSIDPVSDVLQTVRLTGALLFRMEVSPPAPPASVPEGTAIAGALSPGCETVLSYHLVTKGCCWAGLYGGPIERVEAGDLVIFPHGDSYFLSTQPTSSPAPPDLAAALGYLRAHASGQMPFLVAAGAGGPETAGIVCGFLGCDLRPFNPLLATLPKLLVVRRSQADSRDGLDQLIELALAASGEGPPGAAAVRLRLAELMFIEAIRRHLNGLRAEERGWLAGLRDPVVGRALSLLHETPFEPWTLAELGTRAGASRSVVAERFGRLVGEPPMQYLVRWRMQLAARKLADGHAKVSAVALEVGYDSEAAFSRAFKRVAGVSPAEWRSGRRRPSGSVEVLRS